MRRRLVLLLAIVSVLVLCVPSLALGRGSAGPLARLSASSLAGYTDSGSVIAAGAPARTSGSGALLSTAGERASVGSGKAASLSIAAVQYSLPVIRSYYWSGGYLCVDGLVTNDTGSAVGDVEVLITLHTDTGTYGPFPVHADKYKTDAGKWCTFGCMVEPSAFDGTIADVTVTAGGDAYTGSPVVDLTYLNASASPVDSMREFTVNFRNDSAYIVCAPLMSGYEIDNNYLMDTLFDYGDVVIEPGGLWSAYPYGFYPDISADSIRIAGQARLAEFTLSPSAGVGGSITPATAQTVYSLGPHTCNITPFPGWFVQDVLVDGHSVGAPTSYNFGNISADHTIAATFAPLVTTTVSTPKVSPGKPKHGKTAVFTAVLGQGAVALSGTSTLSLYRYETKTVKKKVHGKYKKVKVKYWRLRATKVMTPSADGRLTLKYKPAAGKWKMIASFSGSRGWAASSSGACSFTVK